MLKKGLLFFALILLTPYLKAQVSADQFSLFELDSIDRAIAVWKNNLHSHIQPFNPGQDSVFDVLKGKNYNEKSKITPIIQPNIYTAANFGSNQRIIGGGSVSAGLQYHFKKRLFAEVKYSYAQEQLPDYLFEYSDSLNVIPGQGYAELQGSSYRNQNVQGFLHWNAKKYFSFQLGNGKHFWGNGYRSCILSTQSTAYPYFKITTDIWKIRYTNLWIQTGDISRGESFENRRKSYQAIHSLSWNVTSWLNLSLFENVIWQDSDTASTRGLDMNYLNPVIFYRPVEFSLGSADNVIVGGSFTIKASNKVSVYGQLSLDEFLLKEVTSRRGWWGNKFAGQLGVKAFDVIKKGLHLQSEFNFARPFTYSHGSVLQNYGNMNQAMGHPLGSNFYEWVNIFHYQEGDWSYRFKFIWALFGRDKAGQTIDENYSGNFGGNIFRPYTSPAKGYDNYIGQGLRSTFIHANIEVSKTILPQHNLKLWSSMSYRLDNNEYRRQEDFFLSVGIRGNIIRHYRDF